MWKYIEDGERLVSETRFRAVFQILNETGFSGYSKVITKRQDFVKQDQDETQRCFIQPSHSKVKHSDRKRRNQKSHNRQSRELIIKPNNTR